MTTQQDRAELIRFLQDHAVGGAQFNVMMQKAAALLAADAQGGEPPLPEFYATLDYNTPDWDVLVSVYRRVANSTPVLVHQEKLKSQEQPQAVPHGWKLYGNRQDFERYASEQGYRDFEQNEFYDYKNSHTQARWNFWRAGQDAMLAASPSRTAGEQDIDQGAWSVKTEFLRSGAAEDGVTAPDSRERPATIKESLTVHDCFGWAWEDANGQWVFVKNSVGQEHVIACHSVALREIKVAAPQAQAEPSYWEEEARRYAGNADFWREKCAAKDAALDACVEAAAKAIYEQWESHSGYVAWVEGGNSLMQEAARSIARAAITKLKEVRG